MARISQILAERSLYSVERRQTVFEVANHMAALHVGAILVLEDGCLCGIFSERDLMLRVVLAGRDPRTVPVGEVMTPNPATVDESAPAEEAMAILHQHNCRHLPVLRQGQVSGMISMRDLMYYDLDRKAEEIRHMREYIQRAST
jgi:signal-transduction protein with cAMP-binding, CBS, and nucleotidyltransferase domain